MTAKICNVSVGLDYETGEGYMLVPPDTKPAAIRQAFELVESSGWEELTLDETGDEPEILEDGTVKLIFVRS